MEQILREIISTCLREDGLIEIGKYDFDLLEKVLTKAYNAGYATVSTKAEESLVESYLKGLSDGRDRMATYQAKDIKSGKIRIQSLEKVKRDFFLCKKCQNRNCICARITRIR